MDSLKVPKGSSSTSSSPKSSSSNVPMAVRFNAGEECIDDIFKSNHNNGLCKNNSPSPSEGLVGISSTDLDNIEMSRSDKENIYADSVHSLSSSPSQSLQQSNDETNLKNNFLQGNFFNRKRSDSIESFSPSTAGPLPPGSATDTTSGSGGTWKLIKGKVSQTFDEIKSSKTQSTMPQQQQVFSNKMGLNQQLQEIDMEEDKSKRPNEEHKIDSESEFEHDFLLDTEVESSRLRRGLANLKSKVKSKQQQQQQQQQQTTENQQQTSQQQQQAVMYSASSNTVRTVKKDISPSRATNSQVAASGGSSLRNALLGRKRKPNATTELASPTSTLANTLGLRKRSGIEMGKKNMEIETGVEMLEDTIPIVAQTQTPSSSASQQNNELSLKSEAQSVLSTFESASLSSMELQQRLSSDSSSLPPAAQSLPGFGPTLQHFPYLLILAILLVLFLPMYEFLRGVLICLLSIALIDGLCHFGQRCIEHFLVQTPPEKDKFKIPDYSKLPIVEIPAAEEHKTVKTYAGWMNEASSYDPATFHISMTKSVYLKLEGSILHIFSTQARIPKRAMWNEVPIDRKTINFTEKRSFDLFGCRIELLPLGLARKRYFNRKYPLQLIVKKCVDNVPTQPSSKRPSTGSKDDPIFVDARSYSHANALSNTNTNSINPDDNLHEVDENSDIDFATTIMNTDLGAWQEGINPDIDLPDMTIPCGDETRLLLFSRADREKEDWYRRFVAASSGEIHDKELNLPNIRIVDDKDLQTMADRASIYSNKTKEDKTDDSNTANSQQRDSSSNQKENNISGAKTPDDDFEELDDELEFELQNAQSIEGLLMTWCAARNPADYLRFMALYQKACNQTQMPVYRKSINEKHFSDKRHHKRHQRRVQRKKDELWKGIDQSLFLGPSGSVVWANVLLGRVVYSCLHDPIILAKVQDLLQKKLASVRLPSFMEDVVITQINLGKTPPLIHRVSQPMLDERGIWMDGDVTYEGLLQITVTTKLNLLRLKKQARPGPLPDVTVLPVPSGAVPAGATFNADTPTTSNWFPASTEDNFNSESLTVDDNTHNAIYDSDAESSGGSSSETDSASANTTNAETVNADFNVFNSTSPGNARRIFKIVDRITASNFFQYATELSYVQRAMENMNANITLRIDLKGLVARAVINIPPPPSDRVWLSFRGPPRLWITAKPAVGDKSMDWSIVTNVIESKLCELVNKHLVYPNMIDFTIPLLGSPNYNNKYNPE